MAEFEKAFQYVLSNEGDLETNASDAGGVTKYGISQAFLSSINYAKIAKDLTLDDARGIYQQYFWPQIHGDAITDQNIACKMLDISVNLGYGAGVRLIQRSLTAPQDGILGSGTLKLLNAANPDTLLLEIKARLCEFYARTALKNPSQVDFLLGWLRRAVKP